MFDFIGMCDNYDDRKVDRYENEDETIIVSTCAVTYSDQPYETAIKHPKYNGRFIVVQMYDSKEEAKKNHIKWVDFVNLPADQMPDKMKDVGTNTWQKMWNGK